MKKGILTLFATLALLAGTTVTPANAQWWGPYGYGGYGYYGRHHHHNNNVWRNLGWAAAGLGIGLGLSALSGSRYYTPSYYDSGYYPLNLYSAPSYGYYGNYWY